MKSQRVCYGEYVKLEGREEGGLGAYEDECAVRPPTSVPNVANALHLNGTMNTADRD